MSRRAKRAGSSRFTADSFPQVFGDPLHAGRWCSLPNHGCCWFRHAILDPGFQRYFSRSAMMESIDKHLDVDDIPSSP